MNGKASSRVGRSRNSILLAATLAVLPGPASTAEVYLNDFQSAAGSEWSNPIVSSTPNPATGTRKFLGPFDNQTVRLSLSGLTTHCAVTIEFDLYVIGTWDGTTRSDGMTSASPWGPDRWQLTVTGLSKPVLNTSFSNVTDPPYHIPFLQNYPDTWLGPTHPQFTGASEVRTLGYYFSGYDASSVYHLEFVVAHTGPSIDFDFTAAMSSEYSGPHNIHEESWGLDNVRVTTTLGDANGDGPCGKWEADEVDNGGPLPTRSGEQITTCVAGELNQ